jgi:hypothetical protein
MKKIMTQTKTRLYLGKFMLVFASALVLFACKKSNTPAAPKPPVITYNQKIVSVNVGQSIPTLVPDSSKGGSIAQFSIYPGLPKGLSLNQVNGVITGTPTDSLNPTHFVITAFGPGGMGHDTIVLSVGTVGFVYGSSANYTFTLNSTVLTTTALAPTVLAGTFKEFFIDPSISPNDLTTKTGLSFDKATGKISGTPTKLTNQTTEVPTPVTYIITGITQDNKAAYDTITITVNDVAPAGMLYPFRGSFAAGSAMGTALTPVTSLGVATPSTVKKYMLAPNSNPLPTGVHLDSLKGYIGQTSYSTTVVDTPKAAAVGNYSVTIRAMNTGGYQDITVPIIIKASADVPVVKFMMSAITGDVVDTVCPAITSGSIFYLTKQDANTGVPTMFMSPVITDGQVKASSPYSIVAPTLSGMSISSSTGVYQGTPATSVTLPLTYTGKISILNVQTTAPADTFDLSGMQVNTPFFTYNSGSPTGLLPYVYCFVENSAVNTFTISTINGGASPVYSAVQLAPQNATGVVSYSIYPTTATTVPFTSTGLTFNTTTGVIGGTPTVNTLSFGNFTNWNYVVVGKKVDGSFTTYKVTLRIYDAASNWGQ